MAFEGAQTEIEKHIGELYRQSHIASAAQCVSAELRQQREPSAKKSSIPGYLVMVLLQETLGRFSSQSRASEPYSTASQARAHEESLRPFVIGDEGPGLLKSCRSWVVEDEVVSRLNDWMTNDTRSGTLWVSSEYEMLLQFNDDDEELDIEMGGSFV
ncbi:hypothetical protein BGW36DRAFT_355802 [Talaromyces proteolyticus]|uniref:Uncharacterized protein n=1 Tax=Talaromyces proteolyticus TaxID=1131652 RepID=A0AAD4Q3D5_9EURO|nr:uncharacterized protein BGW36DRAFT_355802 [Talaromyces proteolyticus]KAH8701648.1 hypothetical protein BGW36DRAFT_355802 [Talaromyces proteolyticus]